MDFTFVKIRTFVFQNKMKKSPITANEIFILNKNQKYEI